MCCFIGNLVNVIELSKITAIGRRQCAQKSAQQNKSLVILKAEMYGEQERMCMYVTVTHFCWYLHFGDG